MSKFSKRQIALTMAFASLLGGKSSALDKSLDYKAIGNQKLNANDKVSGKISAGKILAFLIPTVVVSAVVANEIFNKKYNIRSFYKKYIAKSNDEKPNEDKPKDDNEKKEKQNSKITNIENNINNIDKDETIKNLNINNDIKNKTNVNNNLIMESNIKIHADNTENNIKNALGKWSNTCYEAFKKACDDKDIKSEEDMLRLAGVFSKVANKLCNVKVLDGNYASLFNLFKNKNKVNLIEILNFSKGNEQFKIKINSQTFTIKFEGLNKFGIRVDKNTSGENCSITLSYDL